MSAVPSVRSSIRKIAVPRTTQKQIQAEAETTLQALAKTILANNQLTWLVVSAYLNQNGYLLIAKEDSDLALRRLYPQFAKKQS
jgi:hypothetical protein